VQKYNQETGWFATAVSLSKFNITLLPQVLRIKLDTVLAFLTIQKMKDELDADLMKISQDEADKKYK